MRIKTLLPILLITALYCANAQSDANIKEANRLGIQGINEADQGNYDKALDLYRQASRLDPTNPMYHYETAYVYYLQNDYKRVIDTLTTIIGNERATDFFYQLLGNSYDYAGNAKKAVEIYSAGLKRFPKSGKLHLELGITSATAKEYEKAMDYWEEGMKAEPTYPSNYYWAAKMFCNSSEKLWGVLYGEIFMNLERNSERTTEISKLLFDTYRSAISVRGDSGEISFTSHTVMLPPEKGKKFEIPFSEHFGMTMSLAVATTMEFVGTGPGDSLSIAQIDRLRTQFIKLWTEHALDRLYPNIVLEWHKQLVDNGYFQAYNYWLLKNGDEEEMDGWYADNKEKLEAFAAWAKKHPMKIDEAHYFVRPR